MLLLIARCHPCCCSSLSPACATVPRYSVDGGDLYEHIKRHGPFSEADARVIMSQLLQALRHLHAQNIIHRDLKLENVLLQRPPPGSASSLPAVKIADFGLAKSCGASQAATFCGTEAYLAPEVIDARASLGRGRKTYDAACDMWAAGVLLYAMLAGHHPFQADDPSTFQGEGIYRKIKRGVTAELFEHAIWAAVSPAGRQFVSRLLDTDPQSRMHADAALGHPWIRGETAAPQSDGVVDEAGVALEDDIEEVEHGREDLETAAGPDAGPSAVALPAVKGTRPSGGKRRRLSHGAASSHAQPHDLPGDGEARQGALRRVLQERSHRTAQRCTAPLGQHVRVASGGAALPPLPHAPLLDSPSDGPLRPRTNLLRPPADATSAAPANGKARATQRAAGRAPALQFA